MNVYSLGTRCCKGCEQVSSLATHLLFDLVWLFIDPGPCFTDRFHANMDIPEPVIMICIILIVYFAFQPKSRCWYVGDDPLSIPDRVDSFSNGAGAQDHIWILFMSTRQVDIKEYDNKWIRRE